MRAWPLLLLLVPATASATYLEGPKKPRRELEPMPNMVEDEDQPEPHSWVTITWQPLQALIPLWSFSVEGRLADRLSLAAFGGIGNTAVVTGLDQTERRFATQVGALVSYYVQGDFDHGGVHVGGAAQWTRVKGEERLESTALRPGLLLGPLLGFKWVLKSGFSLDSQIGIGFLAAETSGAKPAKPDQTTAIIGSFGAGWTF